MPDETTIQQLATAALIYLDHHSFTDNNGRRSVFAASLPELTRRVGRLLQCRPDPSLRVRPPCYDDFHDLAEAVGAGDPVGAAAVGAMAVLGQGGERFNICALRRVLERIAGPAAGIRPKPKRARTSSASRQLTATAKTEAAQAAIDRHYGGRWTGSYRDLVESLYKDAGISVSVGWINRHLKGTRFLRGGDPRHAAPGRGEREAVAADDGPADLSALDSWIMPD